MLSEKAPRVVLLSGKGSSKEKRELLQDLAQINTTDPLILVATGRYVGEGFDLPRLDTLFLASEDLARELMDTVYSDHGDAQTAILGF